MEGILPDGASINRPPGFNGEHYSFWKAKFRVYVMATEYGLWKVFERGNYIPATTEDGVRTPKLEEEYDENDRKQVTLNMKAIHMLQSALSQKEYFRICTLSSAKAMWDALEIAHEGTAGIKENRVNTLMTEYDLLRMKSGESIGEFQLRFTHLINQLAALGKEYDQSVQVRKILNILSKEWEAKVTAIEEARGESMASVAALFGSLSEYEGKIKFRKGLDEINGKNKGIALKTVQEIKSDDEEDEDAELGMIVRRFKKFYKKDQAFRKFHKNGSSTETKKPIICYECEKPGHIKSECPQLKNKEKKFSKFNKRAYVSAIWGDSSSDEDEAEEEDRANICLVAQEEDSENKEVKNFDSSYDELSSEYDSLFIEFRKIAKELLSSKKKIKFLEEQAQTVSTSVSLCENISEKNCENISEKICNNCCILEKRNLYLTKTLEKFTRGSEMLKVILKQQRFTNDKSGIGYKPDLDKRKGKKKVGQKSYLKYFRKAVHLSNPFAHCNYCNRKGHNTSSCFHKKDRRDKPVGNYKWVPKGTYVFPKVRTNPKGPKYKWVPKCPSIASCVHIDSRKNGHKDTNKNKRRISYNPKRRSSQRSSRRLVESTPLEKTLQTPMKQWVSKVDPRST